MKIFFKMLFNIYEFPKIIEKDFRNYENNWD